MFKTNKECVVKWDIDICEAKHMFQDLGINFLPQNKSNINSNINKNINKVNINVDSNPYQMIQNERSMNGSKSGINFDYLSDELIVNVFNYFSFKTLICCSKVCKRFRRISSDSSFWKNIDLSKKYLTFSQLNAILKNGVICLRMSSAIITDCQPFDTIYSYNNIQYLDLSMTQMSVHSINQLLDSNFSDLSLKKLSLESLTVNQKTIDLIVERHKELQILNISMIEGIDNQVLISFNEKLSEKLIELNISWTTNIDSNQIIQFLPNSLKRLNLSGFKGLEDRHLDELVIKCPNLIELDISDCFSLTEQSLHSIETHLTHLETLHMSRCYRIRDLSSLLVIKSLKMVSIQQLNEDIDWGEIVLNKSFISTIARPKTTFNNESNTSTIWEMTLKIFN